MYILIIYKLCFHNGNINLLLYINYLFLIKLFIKLCICKLNTYDIY